MNRSTSSSLGTSSNRVFVLLFALTLVVLFESTAAASGPSGDPTDKPNFLIVMLDDAGGNHFGWQGDPIRNTQAFDVIVNQGLTFTHTHTMSRCRPSGTRFLVGAPAMDETHNGIWNNLTPNDIITDRIWPKLLAEAENRPYRVYATGKLEYFPHQLGLDGEKDALFWTKEGDDETAQITDFLDEVEADDPSSPWAIYLRVRTPHEPLVAPETFVQFVEDRRHLIPIPNGVPEEDHEAFLDDEVQRRAMLGWADNKFQSLIQALTRRGTTDFFVILIFNDNGRANGRLSKGSPYCSGVNTQMTVFHRDEAQLPLNLRGKMMDNVAIDLLDLSATLLDYGGVRRPHSYVGSSLRRLINGSMPPWRWRYRFRELTPGATFTLAATNQEDPSALEDLIALYATTVELTPQGPKMFRWVMWMRDIPDAETASDLGVRHWFLPFQNWGPKRKYQQELYNLTDDPKSVDNLVGRPFGPHESFNNIAAKARASVTEWWNEHASERLPTPR